ncbi:hypothetical protein HLB44_34775 [Aquincola sp. S2]|uniref:Uncharacterized protein n=1 Tax=Pseudaquabacterium terrae TaxID=2732868 RepID=A0ABX2EU37_9BURK|nr:hypothetical protein [Aquabacterium terrae]NRF72162.1 hypothetical protein [Aquabacterium terrae]
MPDLKDRIEITVHTRPLVSERKEPLDHVYGKLRFTDDGGNAHDITFDPWADKNRVLLSKHSPFQDTIRIDGSYLLDGASRASDRIEHYVLQAAEVLSNCAEGGRFQKALSLRMKEAAQEEQVSIPAWQSAPETFVTFPVNNAAVDGTVLHRRSLVPANQHPLMADADPSGKSGEPASAASSAQ